jgi:hypothetical protein
LSPSQVDGFGFSAHGYYITQVFNPYPPSNRSTTQRSKLLSKETGSRQ